MFSLDYVRTHANLRLVRVVWMECCPFNNHECDARHGYLSFEKTNTNLGKWTNMLVKDYSTDSTPGLKKN